MHEHCHLHRPGKKYCEPARQNAEESAETGERGDYDMPENAIDVTIALARAAHTVFDSWS